MCNIIIVQFIYLAGINNAGDHCSVYVATSPQDLANLVSVQNPRHVFVGVNKLVQQNE